MAYPERREKRSLQAALEEQRGSFPFPGAHWHCVWSENRSVDMEIKSDQTNQNYPGARDGINSSKSRELKMKEKCSLSLKKARMNTRESANVHF